MTKTELSKILEMHRLWVNNKDGGRKADLREADLQGAYLRGADLQGADLQGADLRGADLRGADLREADLREAYLQGADLRRAYLQGADLRGASVYCPLSCPEKGTFTGFKKAGGYIVELQITEDAKRSSATSRKCRCSKAKVVEIQNMDGTNAGLNEVASSYDREFIYKIGEFVEVKNFDDNRWNECAPGIHFFITREEAVRYS